LRNLIRWGRWCRDRGCHYHVARVNTSRRVLHCAAAGAHSFDGSSVSRFVVNLPKLDGARRQLPLWEYDGR
jgi:hypothetical protein